MSCSTSIAPPNSLLLISDPNRGQGPEFIEGPLILSTPSRISVGCLMFADGETEVTLGTSDEVDPGEPPAFDATLETPSHAVVVWTVEDEMVLSAKVPDAETRVRIWVNHPTEPDKVIIGLG
jgi:hypothetical protein